MLCCPGICPVPAPHAGCGVPVRVLLAPRTPTPGSPLPWVQPRWAPFLGRFCFPPERGSCRLPPSSGCRFPMGSQPGSLKLFCLFGHTGRKSGACLAGPWAVASLRMIRLLKMRNASRGISNSLPSPAALERAGGRTCALRQPVPKAPPGAARPRGGREGRRGAELCAVPAPELGWVWGVLSSRSPVPEPSPLRSLGSMSTAPR